MLQSLTDITDEEILQIVKPINNGRVVNKQYTYLGSANIGPANTVIHMPKTGKNVNILQYSFL